MQKPKNIPDSAGVYLFKNKDGKAIYIGKAKNLKNRVSTYFTNLLLPKTAQMIETAISISFVKVDSEFEALLLEANLIKKYKPKYNIALKDDKSPLYIGITNDKLPRIIIVRKTEMENLKLKTFFGPYLSGYATKGILKKIRKVFPYSTHLPTNKICLYKQLGLCDPCPSEINSPEMRKKYLKNVRGVKNILNGKLGVVKKELENQIAHYSKEEKFEEAANSKKQLEFFERLTFKSDFDIEEYLENPNLLEDIRKEEIESLKSLISPYFSNLTKNLSRIECFDIAHLAGTFPTASMVTFIEGEPEKNFYRHFKIYQKKKQSDVDSMREVVTRRLKHLNDWGRPDLIIIDGGKPQLSKVHDLLESENIPFIGLAKQFETIVIRKESGEFKEIKATGPNLKLLQRIRNEAHRFARKLHHKQVKLSLFR